MPRGGGGRAAGGRVRRDVARGGGRGPRGRPPWPPVLADEGGGCGKRGTAAAAAAAATPPPWATPTAVPVTAAARGRRVSGRPAGGLHWFAAGGAPRPFFIHRCRPWGGGFRCSRCARWGAPAARPATAGPPWRGAASWPRGGPPRRRRGRTPTAGGGGEQPRPGGARGGGAPRPKSAAAVGECGGEPPQRQRRAAAGGPGTVWGVWRQRRPSRLHPPVARGVGRRASCMPDVDGLPLEVDGGEGAADRGGPRQYALQGGWRPRAVVW